jgi:hypothetical protein
MTMPEYYVENDYTYEDYRHLFPLSSNRYDSYLSAKAFYRLGFLSDIQFYARSCYNMMPELLPNAKRKRRGILGRTGQTYAGLCIELAFWAKGFELNGLSDFSFSIQPQFTNLLQKRVDFKLVITTPKETKIAVIDAKNWANYSKEDVNKYIPKHIKALNTFKDADYRIFFLNTRLIPKVQSQLISNDIEVVGVLDQLTEKRYFHGYGRIQECMEASVKLIPKILNLPDNSKGPSSSVDAIRNDIILGKPYKLLEEKWAVTSFNLDKLRGDLGDAGIDLMSRKDKRFTRLHKYNPYWRRGYLDLEALANINY